jgi:hypothetical protein
MYFDVELAENKLLTVTSMTDSVAAETSDVIQVKLQTK